MVSQIAAGIDKSAVKVEADDVEGKFLLYLAHLAVASGIRNNLLAWKRA
jgi:hypothetical protein